MSMAERKKAAEQQHAMKIVARPDKCPVICLLSERHGGLQLAHSWSVIPWFPTYMERVMLVIFRMNIAF